MHEIDFDSIATPTPEPYDAAHPHKQAENLFFVLNQVFSQLTGTLDIDLGEHISALSAMGETLEAPGFKITRAGRVISLVMDP